ncbi:MFS transporter [Francisella noatunensis]|uniref:MFS transporter n=2 Tax=Francisella noatunensis TaxID=657445 RepID=A0A9Q2QCZ0_9GAMM|nr:MFS transporter [Francisella noatunensis]NBH63713.1 MFS transporter [Francisella noatunensis subsp. noatunensis]QOG54597.1 MFS transporter [Francisella noatunensis subsp. noatunensis FSC774]MBK2033792.1 MFS transporter [Francisella noatunensis]MBK2048180.1 MFS transporter [Francisella noatunensis]
MTVRQTLFLILTPIIAMCVLSFGNGYFTTYSSIELNSLGRSNLMIGIISAAYFLGMTAGSYFSQFTIVRVGYIRAFVLFASLMAISTLIVGINKSVPIWVFFRFVCGYSLAALFIVIESWCILSAERKNRGLVFSIYLFVYYGTQALSQLMINVHFSNGLLAYCFISLLCSVAIVLMAFTKTVAPVPHSEEVCSLIRIIKKVPLAMAASVIGGSLLGSIYTLLPIFMVRANFQHDMVSVLMMTTILGGMLLQVPIGKISDLIDRRKVILLAGAGILIASLLIAIFHTSYLIFGVVIFVFGGCAFVIYPLSISHASDFLEENEVLGAIGVLTIAYGIGSVVSPVIISSVMSVFGPFGFFIITAILSAILCVYSTYRIFVRKSAVDTSSFTIATPESLNFCEVQEIVSEK